MRKQAASRKAPSQHPLYCTYRISYPHIITPLVSEEAGHRLVRFIVIPIRKRAFPELCFGHVFYKLRYFFFVFFLHTSPFILPSRKRACNLFSIIFLSCGQRSSTGSSLGRERRPRRRVQFIDSVSLARSGLPCTQNKSA